MPKEAQTVLVSAVIRNANAIGQWLIGETAQIVDGGSLLPTARSIAFSTWLERLGQLIFFESESFNNYDYFVPRAIEQKKLARYPRETKDRQFPEKGVKASKDISLYLGIKLAPSGAVAIFCGRKNTASGLAERAVEIYARKYTLTPPAAYSTLDEILRLKHLINSHFGNDSVLSRAAELGIFIHHGNTPHGLRLAIEYAMQKGLIKLVICTSTLAQGVNLPIRYLIVSGIYQAGERIKTRDFQNLIGRAGRAGMHTEGLVIFADPEVYDKRHSKSWMFDMSVHLLKPENSEDTTSSLLSLLSPLHNANGKVELQFSSESLCKLLLAGEEQWKLWSNAIENRHRQQGFSEKTLLAEINTKRKLLSSVESYLMANRGSSNHQEFKAAAQNLATFTLAYHLGTEDQQRALSLLFGLLADYIEAQVPGVERQAIYAKTLLGVEDAKNIEEWVSTNRDALLKLKSNEEWLQAVWPLFSTLSDDKFFHGIEPSNLTFTLALGWLKGVSYQDLIEFTEKKNATKPWGETQRRRLLAEDVMDFCERRLGYQCPLIVAAISLFLFGEREPDDEESAALTLFQKSLQYGLPDWLSISTYDHGFADRVIALTVRNSLIEDGYEQEFFKPSLQTHEELLTQILEKFPTYFESVLKSLI